MPLDLAVEWPRVVTEGLLPELAKRGPIVVADGDPAEREEALLVELAALVQEEQVHGTGA